MSEKFLIKFFAKLKSKDFAKDTFLLEFYKLFKKEKSENLFEFYIQYITRNVEFTESDKLADLRAIYDDIKNKILDNTERDSTVITINKKKALKVLSEFIRRAYIITYENPNQEYTIHDQEYMDITTINIVKDILDSGVTLPPPQKDPEFGQRSELLNIWQDTRKKCSDLIENEQLYNLLSKIFYIDSKVFLSNATTIKQAKLSTVLLSTEVKIRKTDVNDKTYFETVQEDILPVENFISSYTNVAYNTLTTLTANYPISDLNDRVSKKNKSIYICAGSQNICGGNADQGINNLESMLYMTTSYSIAIERASHAFPLTQSQVIICPNVLVFKTIDYKILENREWSRVAIMNAPCKYKPTTNLIDQDTNIMDARLYNSTTELSQKDYTRIKTNLMTAIETALFFGYDTIILDDRGVTDNWLPVYPIVKIIKEVIYVFKGRVKEFVISINKSNSYNVFKNFF